MSGHRAADPRNRSARHRPRAGTPSAVDAGVEITAWWTAKLSEKPCQGISSVILRDDRWDVEVIEDRRIASAADVPVRYEAEVGLGVTVRAYRRDARTGVVWSSRETAWSVETFDICVKEMKGHD